METVDVLVVGARCAGAATAMLLARRGLKVLLVDRAPYGSDALSTHAIMRGGVLQLARWGLLDPLRAAGTPLITRTTFHYGDEALPIDLEPRGAVPGLVAPRRTVLDPLLVDAAAAAGAEVRHGVSLTRLLHTWDRRVAGAVLRDRSGRSFTVRAAHVIGADGVRSTVGELAGARVQRQGRHASALLYGHFGGLGLDGTHWYWGEGVAAGAIPTNGDNTCVFVSVPSAWAPEAFADRERAMVELLERVDPGLAARVGSAERDGPLRTFRGLRGMVRQCVGEGWALVGDAGYYKDPLTAHGQTDALRDAELVARGVIEGDLSAYPAVRDGLSLPLFEISDAVASFDWTLAEVQQLHRRLSREMNREAAWIEGLDAVASSSAA